MRRSSLPSGIRLDARAAKAAVSFLAAALLLFVSFQGTGDFGIAAATTTNRIAAGTLHSLAIDDAGNVWAFGDNTYGQLGDGTTTRRYSPIMAYAASPSRRAVSVAAGETHSLVLMNDGSVWAFGANPTGALSTNSSSAKILAPTQVRLQNGGTLGGVASLSAGGSSSAALLSDGTVRVWGKGLRPTTVLSKATGNALTGLVAVSVGSSQVLVLKSDGAVYECPSTSPSQAEPVLVKEQDGTRALDGIASISAGKGFGMAVGRNGSLYSFGSAGSGVLGRDTSGAADPVAGLVLASSGGTALTGVSSVDCGPDHVVAILSGGSLSGWGLADGGRLGPGHVGTLPYPVSLGFAGATEVAVGGRHVLTRSMAGAVQAFGSNSVGQAFGENTGILEPHTVTMTTRIWRTTDPTIKSVKVTTTSISLTWRSADLFEDNVKGFIVRWTLPDGSAFETLQLPGTVRGVTIGNLASGTNHTLRVVAIGTSGTAEEAPAIVVQTRPAISPSISPDVTPATTGTVTPADGSPAAPTPLPTLGGEDLSRKMSDAYRKTLNDVLLGAVLLASIAVALKAIAYRASHRNLVEKDD